MKTRCLILINAASYLAEVEPRNVIKATRYYEGGAIGLANGATLNLPEYTDRNGNGYRAVRKINEHWKPGHKGRQWGYVLDGNYTLLANEVNWEMVWKADWISQCIGGSFEDWYEKLLAESKAPPKDDK